MKTRQVHLQYRFGGEAAQQAAAAQRGAEVDNPLFDLLSALADAGSIQQAARELSLSYRHLWGQLKQWEQRLGEPLVNWERGQPARLTPFAERLLWAERQARVRMAPHIAALRHELQRVLDEAFDGSRQVLRIAASHDLALPVLQVLAAQAQRLHIELRFAGSVDALRSLAEGRCVVAGFHVPVALASVPAQARLYAREMKPLLRPGRHKLIACMRRRQGLLVAPGNPLQVAGLADVADRGLRFAQREAGSGTGLLIEHLVAAAGRRVADLNVSTMENSHLAVATAVAAGRADAGVALEGEAIAHRLGFVPLVEEDYVLVCLAEALEQPGLRELRELLAGAEWRAALERQPGYAPVPDAGAVLSLTRALPWWHFRTPRRPARA